MPVDLRLARTSDRDVLTEMLVAAAYWRPDGPSGSVGDVLSQADLAHYVVGWPRLGDLGVIAEEAGRAVGAAWIRLLPASDPGYGFVDEAIPELSMAVAHAHRGRGTGRRLLAELIERAERDGVPAICLSVEPDNPARRLYEHAGFRQVGSVDGSPTMVLRLPRGEVGPRG